MKRYKGDSNREMKGGTKQIMHPIHVSKVALIDPETGFSKITKIKSH